VGALSRNSEDTVVGLCPIKLRNDRIGLRCELHPELSGKNRGRLPEPVPSEAVIFEVK